MRQTLILFVLHCLILFRAHAVRITGTVTDDKGNSLAYSSILVKGTTTGVTANNAGKYFLDLSPGDYTLICQYVGYGRRDITAVASSMVPLSESTSSSA